MSLPGRGSFVVASTCLALVGLMHLIAHFAYKPDDPRMLSIETSLKDYHAPMGLGMTPSLWDMQSSVTLTMALAFLWIGLLGVFVATADVSAGVLRRFTFVNLASCGVLVLVYAYLRVPPPLVTIAIVETLFAFSLVRQALGLTARTPSA